MIHSYTKMSVHIVWGTKNREKFLTKQVRPQVHDHLCIYAKENNIGLDILNVQSDHVHLLVHLQSNQNLDHIVKLLKGESSHWINAENLIQQKFSWQRGYGAFSISPSHIDAVRYYIKNQDEHHRKKSFKEEFQTILKKYGFSPLETDESVPG